MRKGLRFKTMCYPATNIIIEHTTRETIVDKLDNLYKECSVYHPRDAVCRYDCCERINEHHIAPSRDIYFRCVPTLNHSWSHYYSNKCCDKRT